MWSQMIFLVIAIVAVAFLALIAIALSNSRRHVFDVQEYQTRWLKIENSLDKNDPKSYKLAVMEADKLVDKALKEMGVSGKTMGEKLKKLGDKLPEIKKVWQAHLLRNKIVHESDVEVDYAQARWALMTFRQTLKNLGAI